jgi:hypothetical protein
MPKRRFDGRRPLDSDNRLPSRHLVELLSRALLDSALRDMLFADPEAIVRAFGLDPDETRRVKRLDRQKFEQRVAALRSG